MCLLTHQAEAGRCAWKEMRLNHGGRGYLKIRLYLLHLVSRSGLREEESRATASFLETTAPGSRPQ